MAKIDERIKSILENLEQVNEDLLALSDDIWLSIDHNDTEAMSEGVKFKTSYNNKLTEFSKLSDSISNLVEEFTGTSPEHVEAELSNTAESDRIIAELDKKEKHYLSENFTYKRPYGFSFKGKAYKDVKTWKRVYILFLKQLSETERNFKNIINESSFVSKRGIKAFSTSGNELRSAKKINKHLFVETNLSANYTRDRMLEVLDVFGYKEKDFVVYLREDRDFKSS